MVTSWTKLDLHLLKVGLIVLKIHPFLCFQIPAGNDNNFIEAGAQKGFFLALESVANVFPRFHGIWT
jgi:hypothetical protein